MLFSASSLIVSHGIAKSLEGHAHTYWVPNAIRQHYLKHRGPLVQA